MGYLFINMNIWSIGGLCNGWREMTGVYFGLEFENYKSFGEGFTGFEVIAPANVIIGRNNSGKSALLDLVEWACEPNAFPAHLWHAGKAPRVLLHGAL
jgi:hypothetical protein